MQTSDACQIDLWFVYGLNFYGKNKIYSVNRILYFGE